MAAELNHRSTVLDALNHKAGARVPIDFGGASTTGMHVSCVAALRDYYGLERRPVKVHEPYQMLGLLDEDLLDVMGIDVVGVYGRNSLFGNAMDKGWKTWSFNGLDVLVPVTFNVTTGADGCTLTYPQGDVSVLPSARMPKDGYFFDSIVRQPPIDEDQLDPEDNLEEFTAVGGEDIAWFAKSANEARATGRLVVANFGGTAFGDIALVPAPFLKEPKGIRDIAEWYMSTCVRQDYIHAVFARQCEVAIDNLQRIHAAVGNNIDVIYICGTDFGTQTSTFCSEKTFRELYFPYYKRLNDWIHGNTSWKVFKHSCGAVERFINAFIECGIDILNPVQCSATGMEPKYLKKTYGDHVVFWGGGVDTQKVLPFGSPIEIREQVLSRCEIFSQNGGFVFCSIHNVQARTPVENIVAMIDAVHEFNG